MNDMNSQFPILRIEMQAAKYTLQKFLDDRHDELQRMVGEALDKALPNIQKQIDAQMDEAVRESVARALRAAADSAVARLSDDLVERLGGKLEDALRRRVR